MPIEPRAIAEHRVRVYLPGAISIPAAYYVVVDGGKALGIVLALPFGLQGGVIHVQAVGRPDIVYTPSVIRASLLAAAVGHGVFQTPVAPDDVVIYLRVAETRGHGRVFVPVTLGVYRAAPGLIDPGHDVPGEGVVKDLGLERVVERDRASARGVLPAVVGYVLREEVVVDLDL